MNRTDVLFNKVLSCVLATHGAFILLFCLPIFVTPTPNAKAGRKLKVQTVNLSEAPETPQINVVQPQVAQASVASIEINSKSGQPSAPEPKPATPVKPEIKPQIKTSPQAKSTPKPQPKQPEASKKPQPKQPEVSKEPQPKQPEVSKEPPPKQPEASKKLPPKQPEVSKKPPPKPSDESKPAQLALNEMKQKVDAERQKLLSKAKESLNQIKAINPKAQANLVAIHSQPIEKLQSEVYATNDSLFSSERNGNYRDELVASLKRYLKLPGYGSVTIELTLLRSGKIKAFKILKDENSENRKQIEKIVPTLSFPSFGSSYENEAQHAFTITLTNDL